MTGSLWVAENEPVLEFKGAYRPLHNFWTHAPIPFDLWPVVLGREADGLPWAGELEAPTVEHPFQAAKIARPRHKGDVDRYGTVEAQLERVLGRPHEGRWTTAAEAKAAGGPRASRPIQLRSDWEQIKVPVMLACLRAKFDPTGGEEQREFAQLLVHSSPRVLVEGNTWGDDYWGVLDRGKGRGKNMLGRLLMLVRAELLVSAASGVPVRELR